MFASLSRAAPRRPSWVSAGLLPLLALLLLALVPGLSHAAEAAGEASLLTVFGIPVEFLLFACVLLGVAIFHHHTFNVALTGVIVIALYKLVFTDFHGTPGFGGLLHHLAEEWVILANLLMLLLGFVVLARHFEKSHIPVILPRYLPDDWKGALVLLCLIFVLSAFLDNIAAAMIGGALAHQLFNARVHIGYLAAIVAASNAGGAGSVVGDTTTIMMWISGADAGHMLIAFIGSAAALAVFGVLAAHQQQAYSPIIKNAHTHTHVDWTRVGIVVLMLVMAIGVNLTINLNFPELGDRFPFFGVTVWLAILISLPFRRPDWEQVGEGVKGSLFLVFLVLCASMMPVETLPPPGWSTAFGLGLISSVFDNIPLTALAIEQGGYDWGILAYAVGFGGSMMWFGSSAGVALTNLFPEGRSVLDWLRQGWHVLLGYIVGFFVMLAIAGWHPSALGG